MTTATSVPSADSPSRAEAARYALQRRLAPSMRHHLVVNLQPIGMIYEVMDRRLKAPQPNLANVQDGAQKINTFARAALDSCLDVVSWLAPEEGATADVVEGVRESVALLATSLSFRGYAVRNEVETVAARVPRSAMRNVLTAAIIHATDTRPPPAELHIRAAVEGEVVVFTLDLQATRGEQGFSTELNYRQLEWIDVEALAEADSAGLQRDGSLLRVRLPALGALG